MQLMKELDLKRQPFGRAGSRFLILEKPGEDSGLYISIAFPSMAMFGGSGDPHEVLKIEVMKNGETVPYEYCSEPFCLTLRSGDGFVRFAIQGYYLFVEGQGLTVHLSGKKGGAFLSDSIKMTVDGALIPIKGVKMTAVQRKGTQKLVAPWDPKMRGSSNPDLYLMPDGSGALSAVIIDQSHSEEEYLEGRSFDDCVSEAREEFEAFYRKIVKLPEDEDRLSQTLAYSLWTGLQPTADGVPAYCTNKVTSIAYLCHEQAVAALAFSDPAAVLETICLLKPYLLPSGAILGEQKAGRNVYVPDIPLLGLAAFRAVTLEGFASVPQDVLQQAFDILACRADWWIENRSDGDGRFRYAYRRESGYVNAPCFDAGEPVITPDLAAYMCLLFSALSRMSSRMGDPVSSARWQKMADRELQIVRELWNGKEFSALTEENGRYPCGDLGIMPAVLGPLLPREMAEVLAENVDRSDLVRTCLVIRGLYEAGVTGMTAETAREIIADCRETGTALRAKTDQIEPGACYSPAACAAVLSLGSMLSD